MMIRLVLMMMLETVSYDSRMKHYYMCALSIFLFILLKYVFNTVKLFCVLNVDRQKDNFVIVKLPQTI